MKGELTYRFVRRPIQAMGILGGVADALEEYVVAAGCTPPDISVRIFVTDDVDEAHHQSMHRRTGVNLVLLVSSQPETVPEGVRVIGSREQARSAIQDALYHYRAPQ